MDSGLWIVEHLLIQANLRVILFGNQIHTRFGVLLKELEHLWAVLESIQDRQNQLDGYVGMVDVLAPN